MLSPDPIVTNGTAHSLIPDPLEPIQSEESTDPEAELAGGFPDWEPDNPPPNGGGLAISVPFVPPTIAVANMMVATEELKQEPSMPGHPPRSTERSLIDDSFSTGPSDRTLPSSTPRRLLIARNTLSPLGVDEASTTDITNPTDSTEGERGATILRLRLAGTSSRPVNRDGFAANADQDLKVPKPMALSAHGKIDPAVSIDFPAPSADDSERKPQRELNLPTVIVSPSKQTAAEPTENSNIGEAMPQEHLLKGQPSRETHRDADSPAKDHEKQPGSRAEPRLPKSTPPEANIGGPDSNPFVRQGWHSPDAADDGKALTTPIDKQTHRANEPAALVASNQLDRLLQQGRAVRELVLAIQETPEKAAQLRIVERRGQVEVTVSSASPELRTAAIKDLPTLLERLDDNGYRAQQAHSERAGLDSHEQARMGSLSSELQNFLDWQSRKEHRQQRDQRNRHSGRRAPEEWQEIEDILAQAA